MTYKHKLDDADMLAEHAQELTAAVREVYDHMERGYYTILTGQRRRVNHDLSKVRQAVGLSQKGEFVAAQPGLRDLETMRHSRGTQKHWQCTSGRQMDLRRALVCNSFAEQSPFWVGLETFSREAQ